MKNKSIVFFTLISFVSIGSALGQRVPDWIGTYKPVDDAVIIFSTGAKKTSTGGDISLELKPENAKRLNKYIGVNFSLQKSHFADHHGNIYSFKLKPGNYSLIATPYSWFPNANVTAFALKAGEKIYLGEIFVAKDRTFTISDQFARDMSLIKTKDIALDTTSVLKQIPTLIK